MRYVVRLFLVMLVVLTATAPASAETCRPAASFPLTTDWFGGVTIPVRIGGRTANLLVDTGGAYSMLTESTVAALGLKPRSFDSRRITMYGGKRLTSFVMFRDMDIAPGINAPDHFLVMPNDRVPGDIAGTLAPDFLSRYDLDFDFANARLNLFVYDQCPARATLPPRSILASIPILQDSAHHVLASVSVDGKEVMALFDTGASRTDLSLETAEALYGFGPNTPALHPAEGPDAEPGMLRYPFQTLAIGALQIGHPDIALVPDRNSRRSSLAPKMILGMGILRHYRIIISYAGQNLVVASATGR